ncbi:hypothetical protein BS78_08G001800 [Paspalum vaginatum]|nr:hypothetical protein BS78_08G001800 [Paspalum vaginatum]
MCLLINDKCEGADPFYLWLSQTNVILVVYNAIQFLTLKKSSPCIAYILPRTETPFSAWAWREERPTSRCGLTGRPSAPGERPTSPVPSARRRRRPCAPSHPV